MVDHSKTYLLVDGENIDWALSGFLDHKPEPRERPRWQQLLTFAERQWDRPVRALFFINATQWYPTAFVQALIAMGYRPIPLAGAPDQKVVDEGIKRTLDALQERGGHVLLASHDADFASGMTELAAVADRRIGLVVFNELVSQTLRRIPRLEIFDLEDDVDAFEVELDRVRIIPLERFDPTRFL